MGLIDSLRALFGAVAETPLVDYPAAPAELAVSTLEVRTLNLSPDTDEKLVVLTLPSGVAERVAGMDTALRVVPEAGRAVTFVRVGFDADPALDPKLGWIIPVTEATAAELRALPEGPGEHELTSIHLAIVVEDAAGA
ncbi:hypothetical protein ACUY28_09555 [Corynebacterium sanguinis]|uniref:Uncharacterized protein n=1 Tax=Corynebacterium sanguinis TaxID=2594913 RepID=A0A6C1TW61_9CORY|nr:MULTISPECIES: hypothetical protein [Corynebacterium]MBA4505411.1 hypothetical protein [Corynebacterium sanguinis]MCT1411714.1 hypothetical protein [Corynebacterium sanguinis]MCT1413651.1 hypothetical protein [Corynebacterium sanguinis]MCT1425352.1 hypothetical protein [Corynebacterium sanguinis]MCT1444244.1 hypothetical protein [Corynebacterium sanguinis]